MWRDGDHLYWGVGGWVMFGVMIALGLAVLAVLIWAVIVSTRPMGSSNGHLQPERGGRTDPVELLDLRYARGEIDTADYEERRSRLRGRGPAEPR